MTPPDVLLLREMELDMNCLSVEMDRMTLLVLRTATRQHAFDDA